MYKWMRPVFYGLPAIVLLGMGIWCLQMVRNPTHFPLKKVDIYPVLESCAASDIEAAAFPFLKQGFFGLQVHALQEELQRLPWLRSVDVRRVWPDRVLLSVEERKPQAKWGQKGILSTEGVVFYPPQASIPVKLPHFNGPEHRAKEMLDEYLVLLEYLAPLGLRIQTLSLSNAGAWVLVLDNQWRLMLGQRDLRARMNRFKIAYQSNLQAKTAKIAYIDLRYTNGIAVGWKEIDVK